MNVGRKVYHLSVHLQQHVSPRYVLDARSKVPKHSCRLCLNVEHQITNSSRLSIPRLLPITGSFVLPLTAYYIYLQNRVVAVRLDSKAYAPGHQSSKTTSNDDEHDPLLATTRAQMNWAENVPLALALSAIVELNGGSRKALTGLLSALTIFRVLHADFGVLAQGYLGRGRPIGYFGTQGVVAGLAGYAAYLVKGYWGL